MRQWSAQKALRGSLCKLTVVVFHLVGLDVWLGRSRFGLFGLWSCVCTGGSMEYSGAHALSAGPIAASGVGAAVGC